MNNRISKGWTTRETVVVAVSSVVFGMIYLAWVQLWLLAQGLIGPIAMDIVFGLWFAGSTFNAYVVRKPGVAFATAMIAVITELLAGNPAGLILLITGLVQGAGSEIPFALTRWRRYSWFVLLTSGGMAAVMSFGYNYIRLDYQNLDTWVPIAWFIIHVASGMLLGAVLPRWFANMVRSTGVFTGLGIDSPAEAHARG